METIPLKLITGFLGSGKTTFLLHYLDTFLKGRKIGIIQNEFSSIGVDGQIIRKSEGVYSMLEINNGSVFCVCLLGNFIESLAAFIDDNLPDEIIMEASGLSDPVSIAQIFQSERLCNKIYLEQSWSIVDACNFNKLTFIRPLLEHQIRIADVVIVNKSDKAGSDLESIIKDIRKINPHALTLKTSFSRIDFDEVQGPSRLSSEALSGESCKTGLQSVVIKSNSEIRPEMLKKFIDSVKGDFVRFKGYVNTGKFHKVIIQGSFDDYTIESVDWFPGVTSMVGFGRFTEPGKYSKKYESYCRLI